MRETINVVRMGKKVTFLLAVNMEIKCSFYVNCSVDIYYRNVVTVVVTFPLSQAPLSRSCRHDEGRRVGAGMVQNHL